MSDQENFLARWSRRKRDTHEGTNAAGTDAPAENTAAAGSSEGPAETERPPRETPAAQDTQDTCDKVTHDQVTRDQVTQDQVTHDQVSRRSAKPDFDLTSLPPIESIGASSDIRAFLAPGVPPELTRAALRQAWSVDPKIRDFVGLAENAWDFTDPDAMPGFGKLEMTEELKKLVTEIFSGARDAIAEDRDAKAPEDAKTLAKDAASSAGPPGDETGEGEGIRSDQEKRVNIAGISPKRDELPQRQQDHAASQQDVDIAKDSQPFIKRSHGGALPE